jgi:hypothetical protein
MRLLRAPPLSSDDVETAPTGLGWRKSLAASLPTRGPLASLRPTSCTMRWQLNLSWTVRRSALHMRARVKLGQRATARRVPAMPQTRHSSLRSSPTLLTPTSGSPQPRSSMPSDLHVAQLWLCQSRNATQRCDPLPVDWCMRSSSRLRRNWRRRCRVAVRGCCLTPCDLGPDGLQTHGPRRRLPSLAVSALIKTFCSHKSKVRMPANSYAP